jgi:RNA recognition motif-containing protein
MLILQVRTLFVSGLPVDTKPRELYLLFRAYPGYESSLLKITQKNGKTASVRNGASVVYVAHVFGIFCKK